MIAMAPLSPTLASWEVALTESGLTRDELVVKLPEDLVPGDAVVVNGTVREVIDWPEVWPGLQEVTFHVRDRDVPDPVEVIRARQVVTWPARTMHYAMTRCPACRTWGGRDHHRPDDDECRLLVQDRIAKQED